MDIEMGFADMLVFTFIVGVAQSLAGVVVEAYRRQEEHPLDDALRAIAITMQEEIPKIRESLHLLAFKVDLNSDDEDEPKPRGKR